MKANEAPEHIYIFDNPLIDFTKLSQRQSETDIEYTRTDAFIEKAVSWLQSHSEHDFCELLPYNYIGATVFHKDRMIEDFKKAMKI